MVIDIVEQDVFEELEAFAPAGLFADVDDFEGRFKAFFQV